MKNIFVEKFAFTQILSYSYYRILHKGRPGKKMDWPTVNLVNIHPTVTMPFFCPISLRRHNSATEYQKLSSNLQNEDISFFLQLYLHISFLWEMFKLCGIDSAILNIHDITAWA